MWYDNAAGAVCYHVYPAALAGDRMLLSFIDHMGQRAPDRNFTLHIRYFYKEKMARSSDTELSLGSLHALNKNFLKFCVSTVRTFHKNKEPSRTNNASALVIYTGSEQQDLSQP